MRVIEQHVRVPGEALLALDEHHVDVAGAALPLLLQGDGERDIGWAESDAQDVINEHAAFLCRVGCRRHMGRVVGRSFGHVTRS